MTSGELVASLPQIDGQRDKGKYPPNFHFRSKPFLHFYNGPDGPTLTSGSAGLRTGHRINAEATRGSAGAGEGARHRRARVPTAEARVGAKGHTERGGYLAPRDGAVVTVRNGSPDSRPRKPCRHQSGRERASCRVPRHSEGPAVGTVQGPVKATMLAVGRTSGAQPELQQLTGSRPGS